MNARDTLIARYLTRLAEMVMRGTWQSTIDKSPVRTFYTVSGYYDMYKGNFSSQGQMKCDVCMSEVWSKSYYHAARFKCCNAHATSAEKVLASGATWRDALQLSLCNGILREISICMKTE